jgi:hypothetical protein
LYIEDAAPGEGANPLGGAGITHKLINRAEIRIRVQDIENAEKPVLETLSKYGAYSASTQIYENSRRYTIRTPSPSYNSVLEAINGMGKVLYRSESAEDVTLKYYDLESRLAVKQELLKTFQAYLVKARNIEEILQVETRIADLQNEIDWTGTQLKSLANLVDYATIQLEILGPVTAPSYSQPTLKERLEELFSSFEDFAMEALLLLIGFVVYGIPCILAAIVLFWLLFGRAGLLRRLFLAAAGKKKLKPSATIAESNDSGPKIGNFTGV